jgi:tetratricopeptide (TPR) repeat protein
VSLTAYLLVRHLLGISIPEGPGASMVELLGAVGAVAVRGIALFSIPTAPDALPPFVHRPWVGGAAIILVLPALRYLPGRLWLATLVGALPVLVLAAPVSMANGVVSDRYFYAAATLLAAGAALLYAQLERMHAPWARALPALVALPLLCVPFATSRSLDWLDTGSLFEAAVQTHPQNPEAQFRLAHHLHTARGDCEAAIGLYRAAMWGSSRAGNNLQACFLDLGRTRDAAALGPQLIANDPENPNPALNTARAYRGLSDLESAEQWAREGVRRAPERAASHVLLAESGRHADAHAAFQHALSLDPKLAIARQGIATALHHLRKVS